MITTSKIKKNPNIYAMLQYKQINWDSGFLEGDDVIKEAR